MKNQITELFESFKKTGFALEQQLNQLIQDMLNNEEVVNLANAHSKALESNLQLLQKYAEVLTTILHLPTKDDIASVAKLTLQVEDKVDKLEECMHKLTSSLKKGKSLKVEDVKGTLRKTHKVMTKPKSVFLRALLMELEAGNKKRLNDFLQSIKSRNEDGSKK